MADPISQQGLYQDGNSIFENVHILGTLEVTGIVNTETTIKASKFLGDGSELTGIDATTIKDSLGTTQIQGTSTGATHSGRAVFNDLEIGGKLYDADGDFGTSGQVLASDGTNTNWVNTGTLAAGAASEVGVTAVNTDSDHFITFVDSSSGNDNIKVDSDLKYNPSSNTIATIKIEDLQLVGQLKDGDNAFGGAGTVLTSDGTDTKWANVGTLAAGSAAKLSVSEDDTETDGRLLFSNAAGQTGGNVVKSDNDLTYDASTNTLTVANLSGTATQAANLSNHDTDDLSEGSSNQYFTTSRARGAISVGSEGTPSGDGSISYDSGTGELKFTPAAAAGTPSQITVANEATDTQCFPLFGLTAVGDIAPKSNLNLVFNSGTGVLSATGFSGNGSSLTSLNASNLDTGALPNARLQGPYTNTVTIGSVKIGAWHANNNYKGIFHANQSSAEYMIISADGNTYISATDGGTVNIRRGNNDSTNELIIGNGDDALTWRGNKIFHAGNSSGSEGIDLTGSITDFSSLTTSSLIMMGNTFGSVFRIYFNNSNQNMTMQTGESSTRNYGTIDIRSGRGGNSQTNNPYYASGSNTGSVGGSSIKIAHNSGDLVLGCATGNFGLTSASGNHRGFKVYLDGRIDHVTKGTYGMKMVNRGFSTGGFRQIAFEETGGNEIGSITINNSANTTSFNETSDYRIKENVVGITSALDKINQLRPVNFNFIGKSVKLDGFLAHEVQAVVPYAVTGEKDAVKTVKDGDESDDGTKEDAERIAALPTKEVESLQQLDKSKLIALLTASIQELSAKNDALEARIKALE